MTPTNICKIMNKAYEALKTLTIPQLIKAEKLVLRDIHKLDGTALIHYQILETLRRKRLKIWE